MIDYKLVKYRDQGMSTYTYFWTDPRGQIVSPYFDDEAEAKKWSHQDITWDNWKPSRDMS